MSAANSFWATLNRVSLVKQIIIGLLLGTLVGYLGSGSSPLVSAQTVAGIGILGNMFVGALKAIAPVLVFVLVLLPRRRPAWQQAFCFPPILRWRIPLPATMRRLPVSLKSCRLC